MSVVQVENILINEDFIFCRVYGHQWDSIEIQFGRYITEVLVCNKCSAQRTDHIRRGTGTIVHRQYKYPVKYTRKNQGRLGAKERGQLRLYQFDDRNTVS